MGRRNEPRIVISLPVVVRGFDSRGNAFAAQVETHDISRSGASLRGLIGLVEPGKKVEIEYGRQTAWYRVQWIGTNGSTKAGKVGVRCLEKKYIWSLAPPPNTPDTYDHLRASTGPERGNRSPGDRAERRKFPRKPCRAEAQFWTEGSSVRLSGMLADISRNGCYIETLAPLPIDTPVGLALLVANSHLQASGKVRTSETGLGMGVAFTSLSPKDSEVLARIAPPAKGESFPTRPAAPAPRSPSESRQPTTADALEAVVRALLRKGVLTREELAAEFEKLKTAKV